jgi:hypothetical protein
MKAAIMRNKRMATKIPYCFRFCILPFFATHSRRAPRVGDCKQAVLDQAEQDLAIFAVLLTRVLARHRKEVVKGPLGGASSVDQREKDQTLCLASSPLQ